jgi:adenylylsulfate kinase
MTIRVLIMGLPGSGKTELAENVATDLLLRRKASWLNADDIRKKYGDWDFTIPGRVRQSKRMRKLADECNCDVVIADFVAPLKIMREIFDPHIIVWVNTIQSSLYEDTNSLFEPPETCDVEVTTKDASYWSKIISTKIIKYV